MKKITYIAFVLFIFQSCQKGPCITNSGSDITERRELNADIQNIYLHDNLNLEIYFDSANFLEVIAGSNVIDKIITEVSGNNLTIRNENSCAQFRGFDQNQIVRLHISDLRVLNYDGFGDITMMDTLKNHPVSFVFKSEGGGGDVNLKVNRDTRLECVDTFSKIKLSNGNLAPVLSISVDGTAWIHAENFSARNVYVENKSTGDCLVNPLIELSYSIVDIGNIQYRNNPNLSLKKMEHSGKGRLIRMN